MNNKRSDFHISHVYSLWQDLSHHTIISDQATLTFESHTLNFAIWLPFGELRCLLTTLVFFNWHSCTGRGTYMYCNDLYTFYICSLSGAFKIILTWLFRSCFSLIPVCMLCIQCHPQNMSVQANCLNSIPGWSIIQFNVMLLSWPGSFYFSSLSLSVIFFIYMYWQQMFSTASGMTSQWSQVHLEIRICFTVYSYIMVYGIFKD